MKRRRASKTIGTEIAVANAGLDAQSTFGHIKAFDVWFSRIPDLKPKFVIAFIGINDQSRGVPLAGYDDFRPNTRYEQFRNLVWNNSAIYELYRRLRGIYRAYVTKVVHVTRSTVVKKDNDPAPVIERFHGDLTPQPSRKKALARQLEAYNARIKVLFDRIRTIGAIPVIVNQVRGEFSETGETASYKKVENYPLDRMVDTYLTSKAFADETMAACRKNDGICIEGASKNSLFFRGRLESA